MNQEIPIIKLGGPQKFSQLKWWASDPSTLRTTALGDLNNFTCANINTS